MGTFWISVLSDEKIQEIKWEHIDLQLVPLEKVSDVTNKSFKQILKLIRAYPQCFEK